VCLTPCRPGDNSVWSTVSSDGVNWHDPQPLKIRFPDRSRAADAASAVFSDAGPTGTSWRLHVSVARGNIGALYLVYVNRNREALQTAVRDFTDPSRFAQNPSEIYINGTWYMFFNRTNSVGGYDIYYTTSLDDQHWRFAIPLILSNSASACSNTTPGGLVTGSRIFNLYYSIVAKSSQCDMAANHTITVRSYSLR